MDVGCSEWGFTMSFGLHLALLFINLATTLAQYNSQSYYPYAQPQHMKVLKHCLYIQFGSGKQLAGVYRLNHDTKRSFGLSLTPIF